MLKTKKKGEKEIWYILHTLRLRMYSFTIKFNINVYGIETGNKVVNVISYLIRDNM